MAAAFAQRFLSLPTLGVGLGLRGAMFEDTMAHRESIDWLEIIPENYMVAGGYGLEMLRMAMAKGFPIVPHGVNLSIGSCDPLNEGYLQELKKLFSLIHPPWFSDHVCFSSVNGVYLNELLPLPFTGDAVEHVVKRIRAIQGYFDIPFLVENPSYYAHFAPPEMTEAQFLSAILERADCGLMLDVNNVYVNSVNHGYDPVAFLSQLPMERVVQLHIAGHLRAKYCLIDTHGAAVCDEVWEILRWVLKHASPKAILLERDTEIPPFQEVLDELHMIRQVVNEVGGLTPGDGKLETPLGNEFGSD